MAIGAPMTENSALQVLPLLAAPLTMPSGQVVVPQQIILNAPGPDGSAVRFRFLATAIARNGGTVNYDQASGDMQSLCNTYVIPKLVEMDLNAANVIVSLADRMVDFAKADPEATQFFEAFRIENGVCIWEAY
jgi:hypothetical protein